MKSLNLKLFMLVIAFTVCCPISLGQQPLPNVNVPKGWKKVYAEDRVTFYLPPGAWDTGRSALDEVYQEWRIGRMRFVMIFEPMGSLAYDRRERVFGRDFKESVVEAGGRKAYLCDYSGVERKRRWYYTDLYVGEWPQGQVKLRMQAASVRPADLEIARKIFRTIEFLKP